MTPDYDRAAIAAMRLLIEHQITETPIIPTPMLKNFPGVRVMSFTHMADQAGMERDDLVPLFGPRQDAATFRLAITHDQEISHILTRAGFTSVKTEAICIETKDRPGLILDISSVLTKQNINIAAIYGSVTADGQSRWIAIVNNITKAFNALEESGLFN